jgi:lipopolysaccharide export system permease protein
VKLWQRYIFFKIVKTFFFLLVCFFLLYFFVDLSVHGVRFFSKSNFNQVILYYLYTFSTLFELFVTLAFLLASMRTLTDLGTHREILALQMAGLSKKKLLLPYFLFALLLGVACYGNGQFFAPQAQDVTSHFKTSHKHKKNRLEKNYLYSKSMPCGSEIVYHLFDASQNELVDLFWLQDKENIWHMKTFQINSRTGQFVHHLINCNGKLQNKESFAFKDFPELQVDALIAQKFIPPESRSLTVLLSQAFSPSTDMIRIRSHLYYKLVSPLLPFIVLLAIAPLCLIFSRYKSFFLLTAAAIFSLIALKVILDGMLILGENQVLSAEAAILAPIALILILIFPKFMRLT